MCPGLPDRCHVHMRSKFDSVLNSPILSDELVVSVQFASIPHLVQKYEWVSFNKFD